MQGGEQEASSLLGTPAAAHQAKRLLHHADFSLHAGLRLLQLANLLKEILVGRRLLGEAGGRHEPHGRVPADQELGPHPPCPNGSQHTNPCQQGCIQPCLPVLSSAQEP